MKLYNRSYRAVPNPKLYRGVFNWLLGSHLIIYILNLVGWWGFVGGLVGAVVVSDNKIGHGFGNITRNNNSEYNFVIF